MKDNKMQITKNGSLSKVDLKFYELKNNKKLALMPFIMAGDPNIEKTSEILLKLQENGLGIYGLVFLFFPGLILFSPFLNLRLRGSGKG